MSKIPDPNTMRRVRGPKLSKQALQSAKIRITTYVDRDVLVRLREAARELGSKYQALLNQILRDYLLGQKQGLSARLARLEAAVFRHK